MPDLTDAFLEGYDYFARSSGAQVASEISAKRIADVAAEIEKLSQDIQSLGTNKSVDFLSGDIAEFLHARTFNVDAILNDSQNRAYVPGSTSYATPDVVLKSGEEFQVKYYQDGPSSARAQAISHEQALRNPSTRPGAERALAEMDVSPSDPIYKDMKRVIPKDQTADAEEYLRRKAATESTRRPAEAERYNETRENLTEVVSDEEGTSSKPISREESKQIAREAKEDKLDLSEHEISTEQMVKARHILKHSLKAGMSAAMIAAILKAAPYILASIQEAVETGELDLDHLQTAGSDVLGTSGAAFVTGSISSAIVEALQSGKLGEAAKGANPSIIASITVIAVNALKNGYKVATGDMEGRELADSIARDTFVSALALAGGAAGSAAMAFAPMVGYLLGSFVGSALGGIAYKAGQNLFMSFAISNGVTYFGLVDQDYRLSDEILNELGLDVFEYERFEYETADIDFFEPETACIGTIRQDGITYSFPRRGVIGLGKVGYIL